jgi:hypothetical protein
MKKQKTIEISDKNWRLAKKAADKHQPRVTRPVWINTAIEEKAERQGVK